MNKLPDNVSNTHKDVYDMLISLYPHNDIRLEYSAKRLLKRFYRKNKVKPSYNGLKLLNMASRLNFDIFDMTADIVFEIQGEQHYKFVKFFHEKMNKFDRQVANDKRKKQICEITNTKFIIVNTDIKITKELIAGYYEK